MPKSQQEKTYPGQYFQETNSKHWWDNISVSNAVTIQKVDDNVSVTIPKKQHISNNVTIEVVPPNPDHDIEVIPPNPDNDAVETEEEITLNPGLENELLNDHVKNEIDNSLDTLYRENDLDEEMNDYEQIMKQYSIRLFKKKDPLEIKEEKEDNDNLDDLEDEIDLETQEKLVKIFNEKNKDYVLKKRYCGYCRKLRVLPELTDHKCCVGVEMVKLYLNFLKNHTFIIKQMKCMTWIPVQLQGLVCQGN